MTLSRRRTAGRAGRRTKNAARDATRPKDLLTTAGRAGFVARGVIYVLIGILAVQVATGGGGGEADRQGALHQIGSKPAGTAMLWALAVGFGGMALWRAAQAVFGTGGEKKTGSRVMSAGRAVFYGSVCWGTAAYAVGSGGSSGSDQKAKDWTASALKLPLGRWLVGAAGCVLIGVGLTLAVRAAQRRFLKKLNTGPMSHRVRQAVTFSGTGGGVARGAVYGGAGIFVLVAAVRFDPAKAKGMDATLRSFAGTPAGPWLLGAVAVGLVLFGCFSFASARWRKL